MRLCEGEREFVCMFAEAGGVENIRRISNSIIFQFLTFAFSVASSGSGTEIPEK